MGSIESSRGWRDTEESLYSAVQLAARRLNLEVVVDPPVGPARPDAIIMGHEGQQVIVEVKAGESPLHFGALAQLTLFRDLLAQWQPSERGPARLLLVTTRSMSPSVQEMAHMTDIKVVQLPHDDVRGQTAKLIEALHELVGR